MRIYEVVMNRSEQIDEGILSALGSKVLAIIQTAKTLGVGASVAEYFYKKHELDSQLSAGKIDKSTYDAELKKQHGIVVAQISTMLMSGIALKTLSGLLSVVRIIPFGVGSAISKIINISSSAVQAGIMAYVATTEGREKLANLLGEGLLNGMSDAFNQLLDDIAKAIKSTSDIAQDKPTTQKPSASNIDKQPIAKDTTTKSDATTGGDKVKISSRSSWDPSFSNYYSTGGDQKHDYYNKGN